MYYCSSSNGSGKGHIASRLRHLRRSENVRVYKPYKRKTLKPKTGNLKRSEEELFLVISKKFIEIVVVF